MTFFGGSGGDSLTGIQGSFTEVPGSKRKKESTGVNFHVRDGDGDDSICLGEQVLKLLLNMGVCTPSLL